MKQVEFSTLAAICLIFMDRCSLNQKTPGHYLCGINNYSKSFFKAQQYDCLKLYLVSLSNAILINLMAFFTLQTGLQVLDMVPQPG